MKKLLYLIIFMFFLIPTSYVNAERICNDEYGREYECKVPKVDNTKKVYDYADLLSDTEEKDLYNSVINFIERYNMDLVVVTISENPYGVSDKNTQIYAQDFYYYNEFGVGKTSDGLIVLIDMANRYPYIATRGNAILVFDDSRINNIHDSAYNYLRTGSYYDALNMYVKTSERYAEKGIPDSNKYYCIDDSGSYYKCKSKPKKVDFLISGAVAVIGSLLIAFIHTRKYRGIKLATNANSYLTGSNIDVKTDQFLTTFTSRVRRSHDSGGSGGGSSTSHGSGGSFGGGGGRHF